MRRASRTARERGAALILVLWTFAALTALAGEFARAMREDAQGTKNFKEETISHYVAIAGINEALLAIETYNGQLDVDEDAEDDRGGNRARPTQAEREEEEDPRLDAVEALLVGRGDWIEGTFAGVTYEVRAIEQTGKVPINEGIVDAALITRMLENLGYERHVAEIVADSIVDWRDEDDLHGINGAEDQYYEGLDRPYQSKDAPFDAVEELLLVRGVTREMFYGTPETPGLREIFFTNERRQRQLTVRAIGPAVEHALCGVSEEEEHGGEDFFGAGSDDEGVDVAACLEEMGLAAGRAGRDGRPRLGTASVEARVKDEFDRILTHIGTTVQFKQGGFRTLRWYDAVFSD